MKLTPSQVKNYARRGLGLLIDPNPEPAQKRNAFDFFFNQCAFCGTSVNQKTGDLDHLVSSSTGGRNHISNRVPSCKPCNASEKRELDWKVFLLGKAETEAIGVRRMAIVCAWLEKCGPLQELSQSRLKAVEEQSRLVENAIDLAVRTIRDA
jgi:HNH endonuclease